MTAPAPVSVRGTSGGYRPMLELVDDFAAHRRRDCICRAQSPGQDGAAMRDQQLPPAQAWRGGAS